MYLRRTFVLILFSFLTKFKVLAEDNVEQNKTVKYPFLIDFEVEHETICRGLLIGHSQVLTTNICELSNDDYYYGRTQEVQLKRYLTEEDRVDFSTINRFKTPNTVANILTLLTTQRPIKTIPNVVEFVKFAENSSLPTGTNVTIITTMRWMNNEDTMQIVDHTKCMETYKINKLRDDLICVGKENSDYDEWHHETTSFLIYEQKLYGVLYVESKFGSYDFPNLFLKAETVLKAIQEVNKE